MSGSRPKRLRFVVGSVLLVGAPLMTGCPEDERPIINTRPLPPNPFGTEQPPPETPTMEGVGVPLPTPNTVAHPMPTPNTVAQPEATPEAVVDPVQPTANPAPAELEGIGDAVGEVGANPVPSPPRILRSNPGPAPREPVDE